MRRVSHGSVETPRILLSDMAVQARTEIAEFLTRSDEERSTRRAPVNEKIYHNDDVNQALLELFRAKCAYCEDSRDSLGIEQHRPRANASGARKSFPDHYSWLAYEWENLLLVCAACSRRKASRFPLRGGRAPLLAALDQARAQEAPELLDPGYDRPERHLDFSLDGQCHARTQRGAATIQILELNRPPLADGRRAVFADFAARVRGAGSVGAILELMINIGDHEDPHAGALLILRNHYAVELARERGHVVFPFDDTRGVLGRLHAGADLRVLLAAFDTLEVPRRQVPKAPATVAEVQGWQGISPAIRRVEIRNFKAIETLDFDLAERRIESSSASCMMLLGENATGKSSILEAMTLALAGADTANRLGLRPRDYVRRPEKGQSNKRPKPTSVTIHFFEGQSAELRIAVSGTKFEGTPVRSANVQAYGSRRFFLRGRRRRARSGGIRGLFDPMWVLPHPDLWLGGLDEQRFKQVARAMRDVLTLPDESDFHRDKEDGVMIVTGEHEVSIERHSDGYRSLFAAAADIMRGMMGTAPDLSEARGVVLIDEIETHLHPRWKMRIMTALRKALPQVQFIATTHDPLCLRGMDDGEVQVLVRDERQKIERLEGLPNVRGMRAEQLLTSDFFGLSSTADPEVELAIARRADSVDAGSQSATNTSTIDKLVSTLPLGDTPEELIATEAMKEYLGARAGGSSSDRTEKRRKAVSALRAAIEVGSVSPTK